MWTCCTANPVQWERNGLGSQLTCAHTPTLMFVISVALGKPFNLSKPWHLLYKRVEYYCVFRAVMFVENIQPQNKPSGLEKVSNEWQLILFYNVISYSL
jgi:hypothetical protein